MKKVVLRAPVLSQSGYGVHSRQIARWLLDRKDVDLVVHPVQWGVTPWHLNAASHDGLIGRIMERAKDDKGPFDVSFQVQLPNEWTVGLAKKDVGVTAGVETTICNPDWIANINAMNSVIVPSTLVKSTFEHTAATALNSVHVIPESYIDAIDSPIIESGIEFNTKFNFLLVGQMTSRQADTDRKNIFNTIKWFCETFENDPEVGLIIKTNNGRETKIDRRVTLDILRQVISQVRKGPYPYIHLLHGTMTDQEVASLYRHSSIKAFITLTRGEGFGLPVLEAAASGLPIIATNWSGYLDFLKFGKFIKVDFELKQIHKSRVDKTIFMPDARWADVVEIDAKKKMQKFREKPDVPTQWAQELKYKIRENFSFKAISNSYDAFWDQLK